MKYLVKVIKDSDIVVGYEIKQKTDAKNLPRGGGFIFIEGVDTKYPQIETDVDGLMSIVENTSFKDLKDAYDLMDNEIRVEAATKIGTTNKDSLFAFVDAYQTRVLLPERYVSVGLKAELDLGSFSIGDALDTAEKVKLYYSDVLFYLDTHRLGKIQTYLETKSTLGF